MIWVSYSPDGQRLVTSGWDKTVKVWDATNGAEVVSLHGHSNVVQSAVFSQDGQRVATASWDKTARVWDAATGKELLTLRGHSEPRCLRGVRPGWEVLGDGELRSQR